MSAGVDYFKLFGIPAAFTLDEPALERTYFDLQRQWHPDRFAKSANAERQQAMLKALTINEAYTTLKDPLKRAQYLLQLQGIRVNTAKDTTAPAPELLMEVMELQETLEDCKDVAAFTERLSIAIAACKQALSEAFTLQDFKTAAQATLRLQYLIKIAETARLKAFSGSAA